MFVFEQDTFIESFVSELSNAQIRTVGHELVFVKIYDFIGYNQVNKELFGYLVVAQLAFYHGIPIMSTKNG